MVRNVPIVIEQDSKGERVYDIYSRLMKDRIVFLNEIHDDSVNSLIGQLFFLDNDGTNKPIHMYINSPGGSITAGLALYDVMQAISIPVYTVCIGQAASMAAVILAAGTKGYRVSLPHSTHMIHQNFAGFQGFTKDLKIESNEIERLEVLIAEIMAKHCNRTVEQCIEDVDRNNYMNSKQALEYGLIDKIKTKLKSTTKK